MLVTSNFSFSHNVCYNSISLVCQNAALCGKLLTLSKTHFSMAMGNLLLKTLMKRKKMLISSIFSFSQDFLPCENSRTYRTQCRLCFNREETGSSMADDAENFHRNALFTLKRLSLLMLKPWSWMINPFPHNDTFWRPWETSLLKTLGKGDIARNEQFLLFPQCFYTPVEDGTYYGITRGGRAGGVQFFVRSISPKLLYLGLWNFIGG